MPNIPTFDDQVNVRPGGAASISPGAMAAPGLALARGAEEVGDSMAAFTERYNNARRQADAAHLTAQGSMILQDLQHQMSLVPDRAKAQAGFDSGAAAARAKLVDGIDDPFVQAHVAAQFDGEALTRRYDAANSAFRLESSSRRGQLDTDLNNLANGAAGASNPALVAKLTDNGLAAIKGATEAGWLDPETGDRAAITFKSQIQEVQARRLTNQVIDAQDGAGAHALAARLNDPEEFKGLLPEHREILQQRLENLGYRLDTRAAARLAHQDAVAERNLHQAQGHNEAVLLAGIAGGKQLPASDIQHLADTQQISAGGVEALTAANNRQENGIDDPDTALRLWHAAGQKSLTSDMIFDAMHAKQISRNTSVQLMRTMDKTSAQQDSAVEKQNFAQLKTALHGGAIEQGIIPNKSPIAALWTQAQGEWSNRVTLGGENPQAVLKDMLPRYAHDTASPTWLPQPRLGLVQSPQDLAAVTAKTGAAFKAGKIDQAQFSQELKLLSQYKQFYPLAAPKQKPAPGAQP